jgi:hypothetical protein
VVNGHRWAKIKSQTKRRRNLRKRISMDFHLHIKNDPNSDDDSTVDEHTLYDFESLFTKLRETVAQWNNYEPDHTLTFTINKVKSDTETLGVNASDELSVEAIFGE